MEKQLNLFPLSPYSAASDYRRRGGWRRPKPSADNRGRHAHSIAAHDAERKTLGDRANAVLGWVARYGPATDRMIRDGMYGSGVDMNMVRPRVSELLGAGALVECGRATDPLTGRMVRRVRATQ